MKIYFAIKSFVFNHFLLFFLIGWVVIFIMFFSCLALFFTGNLGSVLSGVGTLLLGVAALLGVLFWQKDLRIEAYKEKKVTYKKLRFRFSLAKSSLARLYKEKREESSTFKEKVRTEIGEAVRLMEEELLSISKEVEKLSDLILVCMYGFIDLLEACPEKDQELSLNAIRKLVSALEKQMEKELRIPFDIVHPSN